MTLKELLKGRRKLKEYDELSKWKDYFDRNIIVARGDGKPYEYIVEQLPDRIKEIITNALEAEIAKLDEENSMLKFIQTHSEARDCTAPYDVILDKSYTVGEFVEEVLATRSNEWGNFDVMGSGSDYFHPTARVKYQYGKLLETLPENLLSMQIDQVKAFGGWSNMDYKLYITE